MKSTLNDMTHMTNQTYHMTNQMCHMTNQTCHMTNQTYHMTYLKLDEEPLQLIRNALNFVALLCKLPAVGNRPRDAGVTVNTHGPLHHSEGSTNL